MSYTSSDPEYLTRDPETSSIASTSTSASGSQPVKKKKPWSKFKSSIKTIGEKMSSRPKFTDPTESSEQKRVKKGKKGKASTSGEQSTPEETPRAKSPSKNLMKKLSVDTPLMISTPFVGYQPASVSPVKSYAKALHKSGSTSESNLSASDIDTPKKSLTLDRNTKLSQESPDSGRASQTMGSLEGSRPSSQIKEVSSDVSLDSDYTSPGHGGAEEKVLELVTKTEQFAQSLVPPKGKEKDGEVSEFLKAESTVKPTPSETSKHDDTKKAEIKQDKPQNKSETQTEKGKGEKSKVGETKASNEDAVDGRKKKGDRGSKKEDSSLDLITSEKSVAAPTKPENSESKQPDSKDVNKSKPSQDSEPKPEKGSDKERSHGRKDSDRNKENSDKVKKDADTNATSETKTEPPNEKKTPTDKPESKPKPEPSPETVTNEKAEKTPPTGKEDPLSKTDPDKKEEPKPKAPSKSDDAVSSKTPTKSEEESPPLSDIGPTTPQTSMSVEEKLQAFLSAEGWSGTIKEPAKADADGSQQPDKRECLYKILVIGELGTGKTSIIKRYVHQFFSQHYRATIGVDFALKVLNWDSNTIIRLQLWDIAGQERFGNMTRVYYKEAVGAFIVFDVTRSATFDAVLKWKQDLDSKVQLADGSHIPCVLLANKCDQQKEGIVNTPSKMDEYCKENNFSAWFETSAKENINIDEAAKCLVTQILQNDKSSQNGRDSARDGGKFPLDGKSEQDSKSCAC